MSLLNNNSGDCGCGNGSTGNCVCDTLAAVLAAQQAVEPLEEANCTNGCFRSLVAPAAVQPIGDTIPLVLFNKEGAPQTAFGNLGSRHSGDPRGRNGDPDDDHEGFVTVFFKVVAMDPDNHCATLQLLKPHHKLCTDKSCCVPLKEITEVQALTRTTDCITVDCRCFCAVECFDPTLVHPAVQ